MPRVFRKVEKSCDTCGKSLGVVFPHQKYCGKCAKARVRASGRRYDKRKADNKDRRDETPPSPCYTTPDGTEKRCPLFSHCENNRVACRSYWKYTKVGIGTIHQGGRRAYLSLPREPNKGFYISAFSDNYYHTRRVEALRILSEIPRLFVKKEFSGVDSHLAQREKLEVLDMMVKAGLVRVVHQNLCQENPDLVAEFIKDWGQPEPSQEGGNDDPDQPQMGKKMGEKSL